MKEQEVKNKLLEMAKNGEERPKQGFYDPEFDKEIRELRPDWFNDENSTSEE